MVDYGIFYEHLRESASRFKQWDANETIRIISHLDADGISSVSIMIKLLNLENRKFSISVIQQLTKNSLLELSKEPYRYFIFTDLGSGQIDEIKQILNDKEILILDHHKHDDNISDKIIHVNPHLFGIDGSKEVSGAGVVFLFCRNVNNKMDDYAHIAIIGAVGDIQEKDGFLRLNKDILEIAIRKEKIKVIKGLRIFGAQTRSLHKVLEYSTDPYIPGVSGNESGAIQFLNNMGISPKNGSSWRKLVDLSQEELKNLVAGIVMTRKDEENPADILGNVYLLIQEEKESPLRDVKEFATLLNACGRNGNASLGIGACIGDKKAKKKAINSLSSYRRQIVNAMKWYEQNIGKEGVIKGDGYMIINAQENIMPSLIGTLTSIISKSNNIKGNSYICSLARQIDNTTKISMRFSGKKKDIDLRAIVNEIVGKVGGEAGGHDYAAGAVIPTEKEGEFIEITKDILSKKFMEEFIEN